MNNPSPLVPQGSNLEQKNSGRARFKVAVLCVIGVHVVGLTALLLTQGCKREQATTTSPDVQTPTFTDTNLPPADTNIVAAVDTNVLSTPNTLPPADPTAAATTHVIVKGDTFFDLAKKYHVTVKALTDANPTLNPSKIQPGQKINIPAPTAAPAATADAGIAPTANGEQTHKVKTGDTGTSIAAKFGITTKALAKENNLTMDQLNHLKVGQVLKIPAKATEPPPATPPAR